MFIAAFAAGLHAPTAEAAPFASCVKDLRTAALKAGVKADVVEAAFRDMTFDERVLRFQRSQPEYRLAIWDYMAFLVDDARIADGKKMFSIEAKSLAAIEKAYGVDRYILLGLWGVESDYGRLEGDFFLPRALASLACAGKRPGLFRSELIQALKIVAAGDVKLGDFTGSWAGAFGHTQFMPSTYRRLAVDFDRDGRKEHDQFHSRRACFRRQLSQAVGMAAGSALGLRGEAAGLLQGAGRAQAEGCDIGVDQARSQTR